MSRIVFERAALALFRSIRFTESAAPLVESRHFCRQVLLTNTSASGSQLIFIDRPQRRPSAGPSDFLCCVSAGAYTADGQSKIVEESARASKQFWCCLPGRDGACNWLVSRLLDTYNWSDPRRSGKGTDAGHDSA